MKTIKRTILGLLAVAAIYIAGGTALSEVVFPQPKIDYSNYFRPGDKLFSKTEGFDQTVLAVDEHYLHTRLEVLPRAAGPPEHFHEAFEEKFTVKSGTLSILVNGEKRTLKAGETITIPPMTRHKPLMKQARSLLSKVTIRRHCRSSSAISFRSFTALWMVIRMARAYRKC